MVKLLLSCLLFLSSILFAANPNIPEETLRFLVLGDVVATPGLKLIEKSLPRLKEKLGFDAVIINGENAFENGFGISEKEEAFLKNQGILAITSGNHVWDHAGAGDLLSRSDILLRPANYPDEWPGIGWKIFHVKGHAVLIMNLMGQVFFKEKTRTPFSVADTILSSMPEDVKIVLVDFHAEANFEKLGMGYYLDGRASAVLGTHTHIQTADEQLLPNGTAYITDLGACTSRYSVLGFDIKNSLDNQLKKPDANPLSIATSGPWLLCGVLIDVETKTGKAVRIQRIQHKEEIIDLGSFQ